VYTKSKTPGERSGATAELSAKYEVRQAEKRHGSVEAMFWKERMPRPADPYSELMSALTVLSSA
jgi:hypothetical protein